MSAVNPLPSPAASSEKRTYEPSMEEILASIRRIIADDQSLPRAARDLSEGPAPRLDQPLEARSDAGTPPLRGSAAFQSEAAAPEPASAGPAHGSITAPQFASPEPVAEAPAPIASRQAAPTVIHAHPPQPDPEIAAPADVTLDEADAEDHSLLREPEPSIADEPMIGEPFVSEPPIDGADRRDVLSGLEEEGYDAGSDPEPIVAPDPAPGATAPLFSAATDSSVTSAFNMLAATRLADNSDELLGLAREMIRPLLRDWLDENLPSMVERLVRAEIERVARGGR